MSTAIVLKYKELPTQEYYDESYMYVALDATSGGYPTRANIWKAHRWESEEEARRYLSMFDREIDPQLYMIEVSEIAYTLSDSKEI